MDYAARLWESEQRAESLVFRRLCFTFVRSTAAGGLLCCDDYSPPHQRAQ